MNNARVDDARGNNAGRDHAGRNDTGVDHARGESARDRSRADRVNTAVSTTGRHTAIELRDGSSRGYNRRRFMSLFSFISYQDKDAVER